MMDFVWEHILPFVEGGMIAGLWLAARDRRKAVDRVMKNIILHLAAIKKQPKAYHMPLMTRIENAGGPRNGQDAPGRVIARSVRRMTKENHER